MTYGNEKKEDRYKYFFRKGNYAMIRNCLANINWEERFHRKSLNGKYEIFVETLLDLIDLYVPKSKCSLPQPNPSLNG